MPLLLKTRRDILVGIYSPPCLIHLDLPLIIRLDNLAYNMIGVIEVTEQDSHRVVNVEFHDRSARKSYHFVDHSLLDLACLGERGALYASQPDEKDGTPSKISYKPYTTWGSSSQSEWTFTLPSQTKVLGIAAGGPPPPKSKSKRYIDADLGGNGNVVVATSDGELIFLTGSGIERCVLSLTGDFVSMVAGNEWVFVVCREGSASLDGKRVSFLLVSRPILVYLTLFLLLSGSQNLTGRLIKFDDYTLLQKDTLPIPKGHTLKWIGISEEGVSDFLLVHLLSDLEFSLLLLQAPVIYDSSGILNALPRFRLPFQATWNRILNTNSLDRREGKDESYWPVGVSGETFMCLILKVAFEF